MSFGIYAIGNKEQVTQKLRNSTGYGDTHQHDAIRDLLLGLIEKAPDGMVFAVTASGHHDYTPGSSLSADLSVTFRALTP